MVIIIAKISDVCGLGSKNSDTSRRGGNGGRKCHVVNLKVNEYGDPFIVIQLCMLRK